MNEPRPKSFIQQWGLLISFGVFAAAALIGFRYWAERQADAPVADAYRDYIEFAAARSPAAKRYLSEYYARFSRSTVASRHHEWVCGVVTVRADSEGVDLDSFSKEMAHACRTLAKYAPQGDAP